MKAITPRQRILAAALIAATGLLPGCSGPSNNTQRGAAGGAALGALAGAVIGNNRGSGNAASGAAIGAAAGAIAGGAIGHSRDRQAQRAAQTYDTESQAMTNIVARGQPPMPPATMAETISPRPSSDAVWVPGYWSYDSGTNYAWVSGHWEIPPSGYRYFNPPHWIQRGGDYVYVRGYWQP